jgi:hypothetical protein
LNFKKGEFDPSQYYYNRESGVQNDGSQQSLTNGYNLDNYGGFYCNYLVDQMFFNFQKSQDKT